MRVFVLGATGRVGRQVAKRLTALEGVSEVVVAGRDQGRVQGLAEELDAASAVVLARDEDRLTALLRDCDLLVNTSAPDEEVLLPALRCAIRSKTNYCDIAAEPGPTEQALELHPEAERAGIAALLGIGSAPGFTNLLCRHAVAQLDEADEVRFGYVWQCPEPDEAARVVAEMGRTGRRDGSWETLVNFVAGPVRVVQDGKLVVVDPWDHRQTIELPDGGSFTGFPVASVEPITLARHLDGLRDIVSVVAMSPPRANDVWRTVAMRVAYGAATPAEAVIQLHAAVADKGDEWPPDLGLPRIPIGVNARGRRDGAPVVYRAQPTEWWVATSVMLTTACDWLLSGGREPGVYPPEAVLEPMSFFAAAATIWGGELPGDQLLIESLSA